LHCFSLWEFVVWKIVAKTIRFIHATELLKL
jgi:hypothetical protein